MVPPQQHARINLAELKGQIMKKLGPEKSKQYFYCLHKFLGLKLSKVDFNKLCLRIVGRENILLHNQFMRSILKNASCSKAPPPAHNQEVVLKKEVQTDGHNQNGSHPPPPNPNPNPSIFSNGDILPLSPRKARSGVRDRRADRRIGFGSNGKTNFSLNNSNTILENGEAEKISIINRSKNETSNREEGEREVSARCLVRPPLGIPFCPASVGGARRSLPSASSSSSLDSFSNRGLVDTASLRERMEQIAAAEGLEGVSMDCSNALNNALDSYLKILIKSCLELVGARSGQGIMRNNNNTKNQAHTKPVNGVRPGHLLYEHRPHCPISLLDFRVAMELNPQQLGEDWPLLLEKICANEFSE